jgi:hypothetical protein
MFVRYFIELPFESDEIERIVTAGPTTWLPLLAGKANRRGERLLAGVGVGDDLRLARTVEITIGPPVTLPTKVSLPLKWQPSGAEALLPASEADLEIAPLGEGATQLAISARYEAPLRSLGRALDQGMLIRAAEATVKDFLDRVGERIHRELSTGPQGAHATLDG